MVLLERVVTSSYALSVVTMLLLKPFGCNLQCNIVTCICHSCAWKQCFPSTLCLKTVPICDCPYLCQILTNFQKKNFTGTLCGQVAVVLLLNIPPHLNCISTLHVKLKLSKMSKLLVIHMQKLFSKNNFSTIFYINS